MIKVMIVDDSSIVRQLVQEYLNKESDIEVIATAIDPIFAREIMAQQWPDVLLLDIDMPRLDGITFLKQIMAERPTAVIICSALTEQNADLCLAALSAGALSVINKPAIGFKNFIQDASADLISAIRVAARAKVVGLNTKNTIKTPEKKLSAGKNTPVMNERAGAPKLSADVILPPPPPQQSIPKTAKIIAIGTSTGGTQALERILSQLNVHCAGVVIVQHMPEFFTANFAQRLQGLCSIEVLEAKTNDKVIPGRALIAPGGKHMMLRRIGLEYIVEIIEGPLVNRHRPSVDVLFRSAASAAGSNAIGYLLTGMGDDGAKGLLEMAKAGCHTFAQNEESCIVFGMPKEAIALGAAKEIIDLEDVACSIQRYSK
jgi:two-component system chemotaxis response regulator CheB